MLRTLAPLLVLLPALLAGCAVGRRMGRTGPLGALDRLLVALALCVVPPHVLGWTNLFRADALVAFHLGLCGLCVAGAVLLSEERESVALGARGRLREAFADLGQTLAAPFAALRRALDRRDLLGASALIFVFALLAYALVLVWARPSVSWDGLWYHDPITCFAIQEQGYRWLDLPQDPLQVVNGYPRLVEGLAGFFVAISDLRWIELPGVVSFPVLVVGLSTLAGHAGVRRRVVLPLAVLLATVPGFALELGSTYIDVTTSALMIAAFAYVGRPKVEVADLWMAALATALLCGAKSTAVVIAPLVFAVGLTHLPGRRPRARSVAPFVAGAVLAFAFAGPLYLRNLTQTGNPLWPLSLESAALGLRFEGPIDVVVAWPPVDVWFRETFGWPMQGMYFPDVRPHGYGHALPFLLPVLVLAGAAAHLRRLREPHVLRLLVLALGMATLTREVMWWGRFGMVPVATLTCVLLGGFGTEAHRTWQRRVLGAALAIHAATLIAAEPGFERSPAELVASVGRSAADRAAALEGALFADERMARFRERHIEAGDTVAFGPNVSFLGALWNRDVSNRVVFAPSTRRLGAPDWAVTYGSTPPGWQRVGAFRQGMTLFKPGASVPRSGSEDGSSGRTPAAPPRAPPNPPPD